MNAEMQIRAMPRQNCPPELIGRSRGRLKRPSEADDPPRRILIIWDQQRRVTIKDSGATDNLGTFAQSQNEEPWPYTRGHVLNVKRLAGLADWRVKHSKLARDTGPSSIEREAGTSSRKAILMKVRKQSLAPRRGCFVAKESNRERTAEGVL